MDKVININRYEKGGDGKLSMFYVGVDGGGTKTAICAMRGEGTDFRMATTSGASWREHGLLNTVNMIKNAVSGLINKEGNLAGVSIGLPYYGESAANDVELTREFDNAFDGAPVRLMNDSEVGWAGALALEPGINIVAGTGSIAFGKDKSGASTRCGGWDEFFSDEGSCYWMGLKTMGLFSKQSDGRIAKGALYDILRSEFNIKNVMDAVDHFREKYLPSRKTVAGLQLLAERAAIAGDKSAINLYERAADELYMMARAISELLIFDAAELPVSYTGGLFKAGTLILEPLAEKLKRIGGILRPPKYEPFEGALLDCFDNFCPEGPAVAKNALDIRKNQKS